MAFASRFVTRTGRVPSLIPQKPTIQSFYIPKTTIRPVRSHRNLGFASTPADRHNPSAHTRHATTLTTSRDGTFLDYRQAITASPSTIGSRRFLSTTLPRFSSPKEDGVQTKSGEVFNEAGEQPPQGESLTNLCRKLSHSSPSDTSDPSTKQSPIAVPQILKRMNSPITVHENIYTLPNFLTTTRIITAPCISYALLHAQPVLAFSLFAYSSITDLVDGYLARRYSSSTVLGSILDPFADKLLMTLTTITLYTIGTFPWWLALVILGRDGGLLLSALYFRWISLPPPRTMVRYWDFSLPSAEVRPTEISKINTMLQFLLVADAVLLPVLPVSLAETWNLWGVLEGWMGLVAGTTVWSGLSYMFTKDAIRFVGRDEDGKKGKEKETER